MSWNSLNLNLLRLLFDSTPLVLSLMAWPRKGRLRASCHYSNPCIIGFLPMFVKQLEQCMVIKTKQNGAVIVDFQSLQNKATIIDIATTGNRCFLACKFISKPCRFLIPLPWHFVHFVHHKRNIQKTQFRSCVASGLVGPFIIISPVYH